MKTVGILVMFMTVAFAEVVHEGPCPDMTPVTNFNLTAYQGVWYEISKLPAANEVDGKCASAEYKLDGDVVIVKNAHVIDDIQKFIEGTAKLADDAGDSGKVIVSFSFGEITTKTPLLILATDYTSYAVSYTCKYDEKNNSHQAFFIASLAVAAADVVLDGSCPDFSTMRNFDMGAFQGPWYEIKKLSIANEAHAECAIADYTLVGDVLKVNNSHVVDGVRKSVFGVITKADGYTCSGKLQLSTVVYDNVRIVPYWVLATDYRNYAIVFSCKDYKKSDLHSVHLWILSRSKTIDHESSAIVNNFLRQYANHFPENRFVVSDNSDEACNFKRSSVYTVPFDK